MKKYMAIVLSLLLLVVVLSGAVNAQALDMEFKQAPIADVFQILGEIAGYNVLIDPSVQGTVSFYLKDLTVKEALDLISKTTGYDYEVVNNTLVVASSQKIQSDISNAEFIFLQLRHVSPDAAMQLVSVVAPDVRAYCDSANNLLVLYGTKSQLEYAKSVIEEYDVISSGLLFGPAGGFMPGGAAGLQAYRMPINYGNGEGILRNIQRAFPARNFEWDKDLQMITGITTPEEWKQVVELIEQLDVPNFVIKGIIGNAGGEKAMVLVEYEGSTSLVEEGSSIAGWTLIEVADKEVVFSNGQRSFKVTMGR